MKDEERKKQKAFEQNKKQVDFPHPENKVNQLTYKIQDFENLYVYVFNCKQNN